MAITLNDYLKVAKTDLGAAVIADLLRQSKVLQLIPVKGVKGLQISDTRWQVLPSVGTRKLNEGYTESTGQTEQIQETLHIYGGDIKVDRILTLVQNVVEPPIITQSKMKATALSTKFNVDLTYRVN